MERIPEHRSLQFPDMVARAVTEEDVVTITGYGAVFDRFYTVWDFQERIARGAFSKTLKEAGDIRGYFNHNPDFLLGRTKAGTMEVDTDDTGMRYVIRGDVHDPNTMSVARKIDRGDVDGSSMSFVVHKQEWEEQDGIPTKRTITELELIETGPVVNPFSPTTTAKIQRAIQNTGIDYDAIAGIMVKQRAGFDLAEVDTAVVEKAIRALEALRSEPERVTTNHSDASSTQPEDISRAALRMELAIANALLA